MADDSTLCSANLKVIIRIHIVLAGVLIVGSAMSMAANSSYHSLEEQKTWNWSGIIQVVAQIHLIVAIYAARSETKNRSSRYLLPWIAHIGTLFFLSLLCCWFAVIDARDVSWKCWIFAAVFSLFAAFLGITMVRSGQRYCAIECEAAAAAAAAAALSCGGRGLPTVAIVNAAAPAHSSAYPEREWKKKVQDLPPAYSAIFPAEFN